MNRFNILKKSIFFSLFVLCSSNLQAQQVTAQNEKSADDTIYTTIDVLPEFPGGMTGFAHYVGQNYKIPPTFKGIGNIFITFVVEKDGSISDLKIIRDLGHGTGEEAIRILKIAPKWTPGYKDGLPVRVSYTLPIKLSVK